MESLSRIAPIVAPGAEFDALIGRALADLEISDTLESRTLLIRLASDAPALHRTIRRLAAARLPVGDRLPNVDDAVTSRMRVLFATCQVERRDDLLRKRSAIGRQERLLLGYLLERIGEPVLLQELLLVNGLHNGTSRRLRALETEHGHFAMHVKGTGDTTAYVLESPEPDIDATAYYWLMRNIRNRKASEISPHGRLVALLTARLGQPIPGEDLAYALPKKEGGGKGHARPAQAAITRRIRELREQGWQLHSGADRTRLALASSDYLLETLERLPEYARLKASVRADVLKRDRFTCRGCGWRPSHGPSDGKYQLEVHHTIDPQRSRAEDVHRLENLEVLCNICHAGVEAEMKRHIPRDTRGPMKD